MNQLTYKVDNYLKSKRSVLAHSIPQKYLTTSFIHMNIVSAKQFFIQYPENWVSAFKSLNAQNEEVDPGDPHACKFCLIGYIQHHTLFHQKEPDVAWQPTIALLNFVAREMGYQSVIFINDKIGYSKVLTLLNTTIDALKAIPKRN